MSAVCGEQQLVAARTIASIQDVQVRKARGPVRAGNGTERGGEGAEDGQEEEDEGECNQDEA